MQDFQTTLKTRATLSGFGVHSGKPVSLQFLPADPDTGVVFHHLDADGPAVEIRALVSVIGGTDLCTVLGDPAGRHVGTVEHVMVVAKGGEPAGIDDPLDLPGWGCTVMVTRSTPPVPVSVKRNGRPSASRSTTDGVPAWACALARAARSGSFAGSAARAAS